MGDKAVLFSPETAAGPVEAGSALPAAGTRLVAVIVDDEAQAEVLPDRRLAFDAFFRDHYSNLLRALYLVTGNRHEAEELAQDTFVRAYERWELVSRAENRAGYLYRMALNLHRSKLRRMARAAKKVVKPFPEPDAMQAVDDRDAIGHALGEISSGQREAVVLVEWMGLSHEEAGAALGISPITVRVRIHRARAVLRPLLQEGEG
jgi:RNA polymerase sigma factor (sigma-70 family)